MPQTGPLGDLLGTLLERRPFYRKSGAKGALDHLCAELLTGQGAATGLQSAAAVLEQFRNLSDDEAREFFTMLNDAFDVDAVDVLARAEAYKEDPSPAHFKRLVSATESRRQVLFRRLNQVPNGTSELVAMRARLLKLLKEHPEFGRTDLDMVHLLRGWFNRGFLVLRQITWDTPASILERIIAYEAVHQIHSWDDLRRRLQPQDRRCFAFFHPAMPDDPLIFVEVALTKGVPGSIQNVLSDSRSELMADEADTAVFYSISNCQAGLAGISFGNSLIKQVVRDLSAELPNLKRFVTLSPIPGFEKWLTSQGLAEADIEAEELRQLAAQYLLEAKRDGGKPLDPVARFHLSNGALVHMVHAEADRSEKGMQQSRGAMVNYLYDLPKISQNVEAFGEKNTVASASGVRSLAKLAQRNSKIAQLTK